MAAKKDFPFLKITSTFSYSKLILNVVGCTFGLVLLSTLNFIELVIILLFPEGCAGGRTFMCQGSGDAQNCHSP